VRDATGRIIGASKIARDITARKQAQEQQILLLREMRHRIKNLFALAAGLVRLSARNARTIDDLTRNFTARLMALSHAHELALPDPDQGDDGRTTSLRTLLKTIMAAHDTRDGPSRISIDGPDIALQGPALTSLALLLHELTTNAAKYGALAAPEGKLSVNIVKSDQELILRWRESDVTLSGEQPVHQGFGTSLEQVTLRGMGGAIHRTWTRNGLIVELRLPGDRLTS
jgi:two-component sensor histidine kinase